MNDRSTDKLDDLMDGYLFGLVDEVTASRVRRRIEEDPEWALAYEAAVARKKALVGGIRAGAVKGAATRAAGAEDVLVAAKAAGSRRRTRRRVIRGVFGGMAAAAAVLVAGLWVRAAAIRPPTHALRLVGQTELLAGSKASLLAIVTDLAGKAQGNVPVKLLLRQVGGREAVELARWITDAAGRASGQIVVPDWAEGDCTLVATAGGRWHASTLRTPVTIRRAARVYLSTDKPIYQPGQTVHMRCLVLRKPDLKPDAARPVAFTVTDPSGNVVFSQTVPPSEFGLAWTDLPTDPLISPGRYLLKAAAGDDSSEQTIEVFYYKLPAFAVKVELDKPYYLPGETVAGTVNVRYHFGKPVTGAKVAIDLTGRELTVPESLRKTTVTADADGKAEFQVRLPASLLGSRRTANDAHLLLSVRATDAAGQENTAYRTVVVARQDIRIAVVAENGATPAGLPSRVFVVTSYPDGRPAKTIVDVETLARSFRTDEAGVAVITAGSFPDPLRVSARDAMGRSGGARVSLPKAAGDAFVLRTDKPIYTAGETANVEVIAGAGGEAFIDVVKDRQTLLTKTLPIADGRGSLALDLPGEVSGILKLHAYRLDAESEWVGRDVLIVVRPAGQLTVTVSKDSEVYRPGQEARLVFNVADDAGKTGPAALSLAAVDEAVYSVQQAAPGLEALLTGLDEELLKPAVEVHGFSAGLMCRSEDYARAVLAAAAPAPAATGRPRAAAAAVHTLNRNNSQEVRETYRRRRTTARDTASRFTVRGAMAAAACLLLLGAFWSVGTPRELGGWFRARSAVCLALLASLVLAGVAVPAARDAVKCAAVSREAEAMAVEDGHFNINAARSVVLRGIDRGDEAWATEGQVITCPAPESAPSQAEPARTRTYFPETMLWRPQLVTDENGRAELTIPSADSITTWRLSGTAVSKAGRLGAVDSSIRVFQPFFVNVDAPLSLTAGDEVSVPLVLYNYTDENLEVYLQTRGSDGLRVLEAAEPSVLVTPTQVRRVYVRVKAEEIGDAALTVHASGGKVADAIRKQIRIVPPGLPRSVAVNGTIVNGEQFVDLLVPADAVEGSVALRMKVYPSTFSELLDGLENIFRMPNGCFEQTSSTTWPNVMALAYLRGNKLDKPEVVAKATRYIHLGYQRLLSFEVDGGGFDWFGRAPANLVLTAYGLMEFADMAKVHNVDPELLTRTAEWLAGKQQSGGAWRFQRGIFHEPFTAGDSSDLAVTAYVTWAIATCDPAHPAARRGAAYVTKHLAEARTAHTLALCANALLTADDRNPAGVDAVQRLAGKARADEKDLKHLDSSVSATALGVLAMVRGGVQMPLACDCLRWLAQRRDPYGTWGSTTPTVLALRALLSGAGAPGKLAAPAHLEVALADDDGDAGRGAGQKPLAALTITPEASDAVHTVRLEGITRPGPHRLRLKARGADGMGYQFVTHYHTLADRRPADRDAPLAVDVQYDRTSLEVGGTATVRATVTNLTNAAANMLVVDIGTPPGFAVRPQGLDKLVQQRRIERYTLTARGVIVYVERLGPRAALRIEYEIAALMPLKAVAAPTQVYSYYQPDRRAAAKPATFEVK